MTDDSTPTTGNLPDIDAPAALDPTVLNVQTPAEATSLNSTFEPDVGEDALTPKVESETTAEGEDEDAPLKPNAPVDENAPERDNDVAFEDDKIDMRTGTSPISLWDLLGNVEREAGAAALDARVHTVGTWENIIFRAAEHVNLEDRRIQEAIGDFKPEDRSAMASRFRQNNKLVLRNATPLVDKVAEGETQVVSGAAAKLAWAFQENDGAFRVLLFNTGIMLDVMVPTGNDLQALLTNSWGADRQLGTEAGAHYFAYNDQVFKQQIVTFLDKLIVGSSYDDWMKRDQLWSLIKLPDLNPLVTMIAAMSHPEGFDGFVSACTRPTDEAHPTQCRHKETFKANLFEMVTTRFATMSHDAIRHMVEARGGEKHTLAQIAQYQAGLGFEGERLTYKDVTLTMRIPSMTEHLEAGTKFISDILNEIQGDNTKGQYEQFGFRYIRSFLPWIAKAERRNSKGGSLVTTEPDALELALERLNDNDPEGDFIGLLRKYINRIQLTYVGYPVTQCPECGYIDPSPSGLRTFDPFSAFFTQALSYMKSRV